VTLAVDGPVTRGSVLDELEASYPVLRGTINHLADSVQGGSTFSEGLAQHPRIFNKLYVNMVKAGELGGVLEVVLTRLAEYQEKAQKLKNKIVSAMVYPVIVMFIAVAILVFLFLWFRWTWPRLREDQLQGMAWRWLIPLGLINILVIAAFKVAI